MDLGCYTAPASHGVPALSRLWRKLRRIDSIAPPKLGLEDDFSTLGSSHSSGVHVKFMGRIFQQTKMQMDANGDFPSLGGKTPISMGGLLPKHTKTRQNHGALQAEERMSRPRGFQDIGPANRIVQKQLEQWMPCENPWKNTQKRIMNTRFYSKTVPVKNSTCTCHMPEVQPSKWLATMYHHILQISGL